VSRSTETPSAPEPRPPAQQWESPWSPAVDERLAAEGMQRVRLLHQMRRSLPLSDELRAATRRIEVGPFRPEHADGLLSVNNRAFEWHPDQGGWSTDRLHEALAQTWFDPDDLLVHTTDGVVDGFCWTKVHAALGAGETDGPRPSTGEIYVIAADPDTHGTGLGRALTVAGLDHLAAKGLTLAMLYVEADNEPAIALYERLGFRVHHSDAGYAPADLS
jgi:mycothiol synthase